MLAAPAKTLSPLGDRVVVRPTVPETTTRSGIFLPGTTKERPQRGAVIAVGSGRLTDEGKRIAMDVAVGDTVLFAKYGGSEVTVEGEELVILGEKDILAIIPA
jgi:chaperonin GroES